MGLLMSYMGGTGLGPGVGLASQATTFIIGKLYDRFLEKEIEKEIKDFPTFQAAIMDIFNVINMALPGKHFDAPKHSEIKKYFDNEWKDLKDGKKENFIKFMNRNVNLSKADESMMITGILAPPAAMVAKKTGQSLPQLSVIKSIPDVAFVPTATILALIAVKITIGIKNLRS